MTSKPARKKSQNLKPDHNVQSLHSARRNKRKNPARHHCLQEPILEKECFTLGHYTAETIDRAFKANLARLTLGISPAGAMGLYFNWVSHLALSPGKQIELMEKACRKTVKLHEYYIELLLNPDTSCCIEPLSQDKRFAGEAWQHWPYNVLYQSFLLTQQWWHNATNDIDGLSDKDEQVISFVARQLLDHWSPSNYPWLNPEIITATRKQAGMNLIRGTQNLIEDWKRLISGKLPVGTENFIVGKDIAITPGKVIYRNHLIELIQYTPTTDTVYSKPILIVPAWIMKYYILDLSPHNSLVKYLVDKGHTVFMISWRNPSSEDRNYGMSDYLKLGPMAALDAISAILPDEKVHSVGYCLGGTLLSISAAAMARDGDHRLASLTLLATQVDFTEAGELTLFISDSEVSYLENMMREQGYLDGSQMAGAFQILRSNDLIWSRLVHEYMLGERQPMTDLMAWNADITHMPYKMHSEYLRSMFLNNDLANGRYLVDDRPVAISDIRVPILSVATENDHVAPWHSVYKIIQLSDTDEITFLLTSGGHNAGIVSEPGHPRRHYRIATTKESDQYIDPDTWYNSTPIQQGSWWPTWEKWLAAISGERVKSPSIAETSATDYPVICDAPGTYVFQS